MEVYKFDLERITPLDWYMWGQYGYASVPVIMYLINKSALFDLLAMPASEHETIGYCFGSAVNKYLEQFVIRAADPNTLTATVSAEDIQNLFRRAVNGEE
jgi:hypothetical protein